MPYEKLLILALIGGVATTQIVDIILHGDIFKEVRDKAEVDILSPNAVRRFFAQLVSCGYCLSVWAGLFCSSIFCLSLVLPGVEFIFVWPFALSKIANWLHDIAKILTSKLS